MSRRYYKLDIYNRGVTATTGTIAYTLGTSYFRDAPMLGGPIVRAAQSQVESNPYRLTIVDVGSTFTAKIANSSGRLHLLGRLCRIRTALNSTASFVSASVGRLTDLSLNPDVASWDLDISDERWIERQTNLFTNSNTVAIVPYGPINPFQDVAAIPKVNWTCVNKVGNVVCLRYDGRSPVPTNPEVADLIVKDLKVGAFPGATGITSGNFTTLRFKNTGNATDYEIGAFGFELHGQISGTQASTVMAFPSLNLLGFWNDPARLDGTDHTGSNLFDRLYIWLVWITSQPAVGGTVNGYLYAPTHEPTRMVPQLIGGSSGLHPGRFTRNAYSGSYSATTSLKIRFSTAAFDTWENEPAYGRVWFNVTSPQNEAQFLDERIYGPYSVVPVPDSSGNIAPTRMWLPTSTQINLAGLAQITSTNLLTHPTWENPSREAVTAIRYTQESYPWNSLFYVGASPVQNIVPIASTYTTRYTADTLTLLGLREITFRMGSVLLASIGATVSTASGMIGGIPSLSGGGGGLPKFANSIFHRFADGPLYSQVEVTSAIDQTTNGAIMPGKFLRLKLATFPNPATLARGSTRIMQVLRRDITQRGRAFMLLDASANLNPLGTPTVALANSSVSSRHAVKVTVASVPVGARYEVQLSASTSTGAASPPAANSNRWFPGPEGTTANLVNQRGLLPSKTKIFARVRSYMQARIGSAWSTGNVSAVTAKITGPTAFTGSNLSAGQALAKWTNGSSLYGSEIMVDATTAAALASSNTVGRVPPMTTRFLILGLNSNTKHKGGVRHFDVFGGRSTQATNTFTTTTSYTQAPALKGIVIVNATS